MLFYDIKGVLSLSSVASLTSEAFIKINSYNHSEKYLKWYENTSESLWEQPQELNKINIRRKFGIDENLKITLFVGQIDNDIQTKLFSPYFHQILKLFPGLSKMVEIKIILLLESIIQKVKICR